MKLSERIREVRRHAIPWKLDYVGITRKLLDYWTDEVAQLEAELEEEKRRSADYLHAGATDANKLLDTIAENQRLREVLQEHAEYNHEGNPINWCGDALAEVDDETE